MRRAPGGAEGRRRRFGALCLGIAALVGVAIGCGRRQRATPFPIHPDYARLARADLLVESQRKGVMGRKRSLEDVERTLREVSPLVAAAVKQPEIAAGLNALARSRGISVETAREELRRYQEADLLLESGGDANAVSIAGAVGAAQWLAGSAQQAGLHVDEAAYARVVKEADGVKSALAALRARPPSWSQPETPGGPTLTRDQWISRRETELRALEQQRLAADERYDPRKAIFAQTREFVRTWSRFGGLDWALQAYHGGIAGVQRTLGYYRLGSVGVWGYGGVGGQGTGDGRRETGSPAALRSSVSGLPSSPTPPHPHTPTLTYEEVYFGISPRTHTRAFSYIYGRADDHRYYWWRVLMSVRALELCRQNPERFRAYWRALAPGYPMDRAWYPDLLRQPFTDLEALQGAYRRHLLVPIPDDAAQTGFTLAPLAPLDSANERWYRGLRPQALGMLKRLVAIYRAEGGKTPLRVTGAASSVAYAQREQAAEDAAAAAKETRGGAGERESGRGDGGGPAQRNASGYGVITPAAPAGPPQATSHMVGLGVDIARPADDWDRKVLEYALSQLGDRMRIAWLRDPSVGGYHLCPNPAFRREF